MSCTVSVFKSISYILFIILRIFSMLNIFYIWPWVRNSSSKYNSLKEHNEPSFLQDCILGSLAIRNTIFIGHLEILSNVTFFSMYPPMHASMYVHKYVCIYLIDYFYLFLLFYLYTSYFYEVFKNISCIYHSILPINISECISSRYFLKYKSVLFSHLAKFNNNPFINLII